MVLITHSVPPLQKTQKRTKFYILLSLLFFCCFIEYVFELYIPQAILLAIAFLTALTGDADENAALCICCIPLHTFFEYAFVVLFSIICLVIKNREKIRFNSSIIPIFLMILWELFHCFTPELRIMQFGGHCTSWLLLAVLMSTSEHKYDYEFIVRVFVLSIMVICCSLLGRLMYVSGTDLASLLVNLQRLGMEADTGTTKINPNTLGILCLFGLCGLYQLRRMKHKRKEDPCLMIVLLVFGIMTASRTFLVCLIFMAALIFLSSKGDINQKAKLAISILSLGILVLVISHILMPDLLRYYISRFFEEDISTGRVDTFGEYHKFLLSHWDVLLTGIGLQSFSERIISLCPQAIFVPHNGLQELLLAWGIPGIILIVSLWYVMILQSRKYFTQQNLINYIPFGVLLLKTMAGQMINSAYTMLMFSFTYLSMITDFSSCEMPQPVGDQEIGSLHTQGSGITLRQAVKKLWNSKLLIVSLGMAGALISAGITSYFVTPVYASKVLLYVNNRNISDAYVADIISNSDIVASRSLVNTYREIMLSRSTLNEVIAHSGYRGTQEQLRNMISANAINDTEVLQVIVYGMDPAEAACIANSIAEILPRRITEIIDGTSTQIIEYAVALNTPYSPNKPINILVGCVIGFVFGVMLVLLQAMRNAQIEEEELTTQFNYPVLAVIPKLTNKQEKHINRTQ